MRSAVRAASRRSLSLMPPRGWSATANSGNADSNTSMPCCFKCRTIKWRATKCKKTECRKRKALHIRKTEPRSHTSDDEEIRNERPTDANFQGVAGQCTRRPRDRHDARFRCAAHPGLGRLHKARVTQALALRASGMDLRSVRGHAESGGALSLRVARGGRNRDGYGWRDS